MFLDYKKLLLVAGLMFGCSSLATVSTDLQTDAQSQRVVNKYGVYSVDALTAPDQLVCVLRQLWKSEFVGQGNLHVEVNEKQCFGNGDGNEAIPAVVNISIDQQTGDTVGKIWYDDVASAAYSLNNLPVDVVVYIKARVIASPSAAEPYGRFEVDVVEELKNTGEILAIMKVIAGGNDFKIAQKSYPVSVSGTSISSLGVFSAYSNRLTKQGAFDSGMIVTAIGYDENNICFQNQGTPAECFLKSDPNALVNVGSYGIYNSDGSRYLGSVSGLVINGTAYNMPYGFGGPLFDVGQNSPGLLTSADSVTMNGQPMKVQWLAKVVASPLATGNQGSISLNVDVSQLYDASTLTDQRSSVGSLPSAVLLQPVKARGGKLL